MQTNNTPRREGHTATQLPEQVINQETNQAQRNFFNRCLDWWLRLAAFPEPPATASFVQRETARKMQFLSLAVLIFVFTSLLGIPVALLQLRNTPTMSPGSVIVCCIVPVCYLLALFISKKLRRPNLGGVLVTLVTEVSIIAMIVANSPFNDTGVQEFGALVCGEMVAITLVSPQFTLLIGFCNALFITLSMLYLPRDPFLNRELQTQFLDILTGAVGLQIIVALIVSWHVNYLTKTVKHADRAEMVATLEHKMAEQQKARNREMQYLADCIGSISRQYSDMMNRRTIARISDEGFPDVLLPLTKGFNMLLSRLQRANQTEKEYLFVKQILNDYTKNIYQGSFSPDRVPQTGTDLDLLLTAFYDRYRLWPKLQPDQQSTSSSTLASGPSPKRSETI